MNKTKPRNNLLSSGVGIDSQTNKVSLHQSACSIGILNLCTLYSLSVRYGSIHIYRATYIYIGLPEALVTFCNKLHFSIKEELALEMLLVDGIRPLFFGLDSFLLSTISTVLRKIHDSSVELRRQFLCLIPYRVFASLLSYSHHHDHSLIFLCFLFCLGKLSGSTPSEIILEYFKQLTSDSLQKIDSYHLVVSTIKLVLHVDYFSSRNSGLFNRYFMLLQRNTSDPSWSQSDSNLKTRRLDCMSSQAGFLSPLRRKTRAREQMKLIEAVCTSGFWFLLLIPVEAGDALSLFFPYVEINPIRDV